MLTDWWLEIDPTMTRDIPFVYFSDFLNKKKICAKKFEANRLCKVALK